MSVARSDYSVVHYFDGIDPEGGGGLIPQLEIVTVLLAIVFMPLPFILLMCYKGSCYLLILILLQTHTTSQVSHDLIF